MEIGYFNPIKDVYFNQWTEGKLFTTVSGCEAVFLKGSVDQLIIFSHGNKHSFHYYYNFLHDLRDKTKANVISYDPPGYGISPGKASIDSWVAVLKFILSSNENIILYGESMGGCINSLVYESFKSKIIGIVHHDSLLDVNSVISYRYPKLNFLSRFFRQVNVLENYQNLNVPIIIIHSKNDKKVDFQDAKYLYEKLKCDKFFIEHQENHGVLNNNTKKNIFRQIIYYFINEL